jgi:hypothetical protein
MGSKIRPQAAPKRIPALRSLGMVDPFIISRKRSCYIPRPCLARNSLERGPHTCGDLDFWGVRLEILDRIF